MTDAELTILSLLAHGARYGHEIQQIIDERGMRDWLALGYSSIYYMLNKFERQNMVKSELRPGDSGTARKIYSLTEAGQGILRTAISDLLREPRSIGTGFELGLANLHVLQPAQVYIMLSYHQADLEMQLEAIREIWDKHQENEDIANRHDLRALYTHSITRMESDLLWLKDFLEDWHQRYPGVEKSPLVQASKDDNINTAQTQIHLHTPPNPLKMLQRLQRPIPKKEEDDKTED